MSPNSDADRTDSPSVITRRKFLTVSAAATGGLLLAACGADGDSATSTRLAGSSATASGTSTNSNQALDVTGDVVVWFPYGQEERQASMRKAFDAFEARYPGAHVVSEFVPFPDVPTRWPAAQSAGDLPDLIIGTVQDLLPAFTAGAVDPDMMSALVERLGGETFFAEGFLDKTGRVSGTTFAVPHYAHNRLLLYRRDRLEAAGLTVPTTLEEAEEAAEALTSAPEYYGWMMPLAQQAGGGGLLLWQLSRTFGGSLIDAEGNSLWRTEPVAEAADYLSRIAGRYGPEAASTTVIGDLFNRLSDGTASMLVDSASGLGVANTNPDIDPEVLEGLDGTHMPIGPSGKGHQLAAISMSVMKGSNPDGGMALAETLYEPELHLDFLQSIPLFMFPATTNIDIDSFLDHPVLAKYPTAVEQTLEGIREGAPVGFEEGPNPFIGPVMASGVAEIMLQDVAFGGASLADALESSAVEVDRILEDVRRRVDS